MSKNLELSTIWNWDFALVGIGIGIGRVVGIGSGSGRYVVYVHTSGSYDQNYKLQTAASHTASCVE